MRAAPDEELRRNQPERDKALAAQASTNPQNLAELATDRPGHDEL